MKNFIGLIFLQRRFYSPHRKWIFLTSKIYVFLGTSSVKGKGMTLNKKGDSFLLVVAKWDSHHIAANTHTSKARVRSLDSGMHNGVNLFLHSLKNKFVGFLLALSKDMCVASLLSLSLPMNTFFCNSKSCLPIHMQSLLVQWQVFDGQSVTPFFLWRFSWPKNNKF